MPLGADSEGPRLLCARPLGELEALLPSARCRRRASLLAGGKSELGCSSLLAAAAGMKSETRLDAAVFQLTPTRTRCDLVIRAGGSSEKIASGLLNPFLAHLKTAREQIAKGGYTITLEPGPGVNATWFTKGTLERFVRFVSTPEILERVDTIESESLQIDEAIDIQSDENLQLSSASPKRLSSDTSSAIVIYQPGLDRGWKAREEESKENFLRALESRKLVLENEQGMAFARAAAAGFDAEGVADLIAFAEHFGAKRMLKACLRFEELGRKRNEVATSPVDDRLSSDVAQRRDFTEQWAASNHASSGENDVIFSENGEQAAGWSSQVKVPFYPHPYFLAQYPQHPLVPHCPLHSPASAPPTFPFPPRPVPCYQSPLPSNSREAGSKADRGRGLDEEHDRKRSSDAAGCNVDADGESSSSSSESHKKESSDEDAAGPGDWWIPRSLLPRHGADDDDKRCNGDHHRRSDVFISKGPPVNVTQKQRAGWNAEPSSMMPPRAAEGESDGRVLAKEYVEILMRTSASVGRDAQQGEKGATEKKKAVSVLRKKGSIPSKFTTSAEAQARASKLRAFKADLQRAKKEKEEEGQRRLEALKKERQQRIAARSAVATRSPVTPDEKVNRLRAKRTVSSNPASAGVRSLSPRPTIQTKSTIAAPNSSQRTPPARVHRLTRSLSSLPDMAKRKEEARGAASQPKRASQDQRRKSEPHGGGGQRLSSLRSAASSVRTPPQNSSASKGGSEIREPSPLGSASRVKKTLATATTAGGWKLPSPAADRRTPWSKTTGKISLTSERKTKKMTVEKKRDGGDTVSEMGNRFPQADAAPPFNGGDQPSSSSSSTILHEVNDGSSETREEMKIAHAKSVRFALAEKPHQRRQQGEQHRRAASMDDLCAPRNPKAAGLQRDAGHEREGRQKAKEPLKGLRKLFKFGRKSGGADLKLETSSLHEDDQTTAAQQNPAAADGTPPKAFRRFSILSSFRGKKSTAA